MVCSAMICLIQTGQLAAWIVVIIIAREFIISGFRLIASDNGVVIAASYWGKFKTTFQMLNGDRAYFKYSDVIFPDSGHDSYLCCPDSYSCVTY